MKTQLILKTIFVLTIGFGAIATYAKIINSSTIKAKLDVMLIQNDPADAKFPIGAKIYKEKCIICHMEDGKGIPGAFPPLKDSDYLFADKVRAVAQTLNGSQIEMVVNGMTYVAPMTPQVDTKEDAVAVINYVLNAWGNNGGTVTLEDVKNVKINPR
ncbi:MAG: c-type cytochrome [Bacteroidetes bacterium]|nr:c-type cytochrome [Bacteroidota bacterium]